jgi:carbohydrate-selective porin OprB
MSSQGTARLDSWWLEKRALQERLTLRIGQFAGQDFYGAQHYAASFVFEPMGYAFGNLFSTFESFDPPSTSAVEVRVAPARHLYVKSMVFATDRDPFAHNPTGLVPQFRGAPMSLSEIGFTRGKTASSVRAFDNVEERNGYSGLYRFGGGYNPAKFTIPGQPIPRSGDFLLYGMANQALWRVDRDGSRGVDATLSYDWSPSDVNRNDTQVTAGVRFNEPLPITVHNTLSVGYVRNHLSSAFAGPNVARFKVEHGLEVNALVDVAGMMFVQPVLQYFVNVGGSGHRAVVFGLRTKVEF